MLISEPFAAAIYSDNPYPPEFKEENCSLECQGGCFRMMDPKDLVYGLCEDCAREDYCEELGKMYAEDYPKDFMDFLDGMIPRTESELQKAHKNFAMYDMDEWRAWLTGNLKGGSYGKYKNL